MNFPEWKEIFVVIKKIAITDIQGPYNFFKHILSLIFGELPELQKKILENIFKHSLSNIRDFF